MKPFFPCTRTLCFSGWFCLLLAGCDLMPEPDSNLPQQVQPLGNARVEKVGNTFVVGHLGASGQDGVRLLFQGWTEMDVFTEPVAIPTGSRYTGTINGVDDQGVEGAVVEIRHTGNGQGSDLELNLHQDILAAPTLACFRKGVVTTAALPAPPLDTWIPLALAEDTPTSWHWVYNASCSCWSWMRDTNGGRIKSPFFPDPLPCDSLAFQFQPLDTDTDYTSLDITGTNLPPFTITEIAGQ
jgi:hypothetical protein